MQPHLGFQRSRADRLQQVGGLAGSSVAEQFRGSSPRHIGATEQRRRDGPPAIQQGQASVKRPQTHDFERRVGREQLLELVKASVRVRDQTGLDSRAAQVRDGT